MLSIFQKVKTFALTFYWYLCIRVMGLVNRVLYCILQFLVLLDLVTHCIISSIIYILTARSKPYAYETISSTVGRHAIESKQWALIAEWIIDRVMYIPSRFRLGHCRRMIQWGLKHMKDQWPDETV